MSDKGRKVQKKTLIKYLYDNVEPDKCVKGDNGVISVRIDGFTFVLSLNSIVYKKNDVSDSHKVEGDELDDLFEKIYSHYTEEDLNNELIQTIRNKNINKITD